MFRGRHDPKGGVPQGFTRRRTLTALVGLSLLATVIVGVSAQANPVPPQPVQNGNFDTDSVGGAYYTAPPGAISNWTVDSGSVDLLNTYLADHTTGSANSVDMDGNTPGAISQVVSTLAYQQYTIQFYLSGNNGSDCAGATPTTSTKSLNVLWNGVQQGETLTSTCRPAASSCSGVCLSSLTPRGARPSGSPVGTMRPVPRAQ